MLKRKRTSGIRLYGMLGLASALAILWIPCSAGAQEEPKRTVPKKEKGWKANVVSELFPEKEMMKLQARIEEDHFVCRAGSLAVLDIPLSAITRITRDSGKDYPVAWFLMSAATQPSTEKHRFGTKEYRQEMAARATLGAFAMLGLLFPKHKEVVTVFWKDEDGEHGAEFRMGRKEGRVMLEKLQREAGVEARDLEKERKDFELRRKNLLRSIQDEVQGRLGDPRNCRSPVDRVPGCNL